MDGFMLVIFSWIFVGLITYFFLGTFLNSSTPSNSITNLKNESKEWINELIFWLWNSKQFVSAFTELFIKALNETAKKLNKPDQVEIHFETIDTFKANKLNKEEAINKDTLPSLEQIQANNKPNNDYMTFHGKLTVPKLSLRLIASQRLEESGRFIVTSSDALLTNIHGKIEIRLARIANEIFLMSCFSGRPEINIQIIAEDNQKPTSQQSTIINPSLLEDLIRKTLTSTVINFSLGEFLYPGSSESAKNSLHELKNLTHLNEHYPPVAQTSLNNFKKISKTNNNNLQQYPLNCLQIKFIRCIGLNQNRPIHKPYIFIEIDEPAQKFTTAKLDTNNSNPQWKDMFEFEINAAASKELLFEVYDDGDEIPSVSALSFGINNEVEPKKYQHPKDIFRSNEASNEKPPRFLGTTIVGVEELRQNFINHVTSHRLNLHGHPYITNKITEEHVSGILIFESQFTTTTNIEPLWKNNYIAEQQQHQQLNLPTNKKIEQNYGSNRFPIRIDDGRGRLVGSSSQQGYIYNVGDESHLPSSTEEDDLMKRSPDPLNNTSLIEHPNLRTNSNNWQSEQQLNTSRTSLNKHDVINNNNSLSQPPSSPSHISYIGLSNPTTPISTSPNINYGEAQVQNFNQFSAKNSPEFVDFTNNPSTREQQLKQLEYIYDRGIYSQLQRENPHIIARTSSSNQDKPIERTPIHTTLSYDAKSFTYADEDPNRINKAISSPTPPPIPPHQQQNIALEEIAARQAREREPKRENSKREKRERSFFDEIKHRLTGGSSRFGRKRATSLDGENAKLEESISMPPSRDASQIRQSYDTSNRYSSIANPLIISKSGVKENSMPPSLLILELGENPNNKTTPQNKQELRYYLIPNSIINEPAAQRLMRNGKKLHVYNGHSFVAVKPKGRVNCSVCNRLITGNFTKQAYQCRDCRKVSHKSCHQRSSSPCQNSNLENLTIIEDVDWSEFLRQYQMQEYISENGL